MLEKAHETHTKAKLLLFIPPPFHEGMNSQYRQGTGDHTIYFTAERTREYIDAAREIGKELATIGVETLDLALIFDQWRPDDDTITDDPLALLLRDGLHFSRQGNELVYNELKLLIQKKWPELEPSSRREIFRQGKMKLV